jgi:hypothetical protein
MTYVDELPEVKTAERNCVYTLDTMQHLWTSQFITYDNENWTPIKDYLIYETQAEAEAASGLFNNVFCFSKE